MEEIYRFEHVIAYSVIALSNMLNSANKENINLKTMVMFIQPLEEIYRKEQVIEIANKL